jgi:hypothetical protein
MTEDEHVRETYAHFGLALYMAQVLEHALVNAMSAAERAAGRRLALADIDSFMSQRFEETLGRLIRDLRKYVPVGDELSSILAKSLRTRNWLAHAYFRERAVEFTSEAGRNRMIEELEQAVDLFSLADRTLDKAVDPLRLRLDLTADKINAEVEALLEKGGRDG